MWDEVREFCAEPSLDELSDLTYGFGRIVAGFFGKTYVPMPLGQRKIAKMSARMTAHGCIRSARHLVEGRCPTSEEAPK